MMFPLNAENLENMILTFSVFTKMSFFMQCFLGMSFLMKSIIPPLFLFQSRRNDAPKPFKKNSPSKKESSTLVSDVIKILILFLIISAKESNLFRTELIFRCTETSFLRLPLCIVCRLKFVPDYAFSRLSDKQSLTVTK